MMVVTMAVETVEQWVGSAKSSVESSAVAMADKMAA